MKNFKKAKIKYGILFFLHNLLPILAIMGFMIYGFIVGASDVVVPMATIVMCQLMLLIIAAITRQHLTSITWIAALVVYLGLQSIFIVPLVSICAYTLFDDLVFSFLYKKYQKAYRDHKVLIEHEEDRDDNSNVREENQADS